MASSKKKTMSRNRFFRLGLVLSTLAVFIASVILFFWFTTRALFSKNRHFVLKNVSVVSVGWWDKQSRRVANILKLKPGQTNLFEVDLKSLRSVLEKEPSIERVTAARQLPDSIKINIIERIPRAFLGSRNIDLVSDATGIVMDKNTCVPLNPKIPVIKNFRVRRGHKLQPGLEIASLKPALELIMITRTDYPEFKIDEISMGGHEEMYLRIFYGTGSPREYNVVMPQSDLKNNLRILKTAILKSTRDKDTRTNMNLCYKGQVLITQ
ncbi:MAG: hypothetical protein A2020_11040 [Lentisphaerae bacterium GWF2_45_14]|nr:MAG: hypothetical protein A2020_11040 [Lentisphaerae bacterium GWF2_45_14]